jgi:hypothetical protein
MRDADQFIFIAQALAEKIALTPSERSTMEEYGAGMGAAEIKLEP